MVDKFQGELLNYLKNAAVIDFNELIFKLETLNLIDKSLIPDTNRAEKSISIISQVRKRPSGLEQLKKILDELPGKSLSLSHSKKRYEIVHKKIYPHLNIVDTILAGIGCEEEIKDELIDTQVSISSDENNKDYEKSSYSIYEAIELLWNRPDNWHITILGDGGMGKTTSLLKLWKELLTKNNNIIPVFLSLERYNQISKEKRREFIWYRIFQEYVNYEPSIDEIRKLKNQFKSRIIRNEKVYPSLVLLLDGFNEVTVNTNELLLCLEDIIRDFKGIQLIITSRYDMSSLLKKSDFKSLHLEPLEEEQIKNFIVSQNLYYRNDLLEDIPILENPMMLTIYCNIEREMNECSDIEPYGFITNTQNKGEMLHNFIASQLSRLDKQSSSENKVIHCLYLKFLLPRIGYEMEKSNFFEINRNKLVGTIKDEFLRYTSDEFLDNNTNLDDQMSDEVEKKLDVSNRSNIRRAINKLKEFYCVLKEVEKDSYSFLHQDFRDYFSAIYIKDKIQEKITEKENFLSELSERVFDVHLKDMLGEVIQEPRRRPIIKNGEYKKGELKETILDKALELLRNEEMKEGDYRLLNILEILKEKRVDLSDTNLSDLDLRKITLNNVRLGHGLIKGKVFAANLANSKLNSYNIFPQGHKGRVFSIDYSLDGQRIVSCSYSEVKEWNIVTGERLRTKKIGSLVFSCIKYSILEKMKICIGDHSGLIQEWILEEDKPEKTYYGHFKKINSIVYSLDGKKILSGSDDKTIREWDVKTGKCINVYEGHTDKVTSICYSLDNNKIFSGSDDKTIREWDVKTRKCINVYEGHTDKVTSICCSLDNNKIFSGSDDKTIRRWNVETGKCINVYEGHTGKVTSICYSLDNNKIFSGSEDKTIREWNIETEECINVYEGHTSEISSMKYIPYGKKILSGSFDGSIREWNTDKKQCSRFYSGLFYGIPSVKYSSNGEKIIWGSRDGTIKEWDSNKNQCLKIYKGHNDAVNSVSYSPDNRKILSGSFDEKLKEWDIETGECIKTYSGHTGKVTSVNYRPDGTRIVSGSLDKTVREWDVISGQCLKIYNRDFEKSHPFVIYSPDGNKILFGNSPNIIEEWDILKGKCLKVYKGHSDWVNSVSYSCDGEKIASGSLDYTIKEWNVETGKFFNDYKIHNDWINSVKYSNNRQRILSASDDGSIAEFYSAIGDPIIIYKSHVGVFCAEYNPCRDEVVLGSFDEKIREINRLSRNNIIREVKDIFGLLIQGLDLSNLHPDSEISPEEKEILQQYGAIF